MSHIEILCLNYLKENSPMKVAIAQTSFDEQINEWIDYCESKSIEHVIVNPYDNDIIKTISDCDIFMWHHSQMVFKDLLFAKQLLFSLQQAGMTVYPNFNSNWHFDDKLGQKYLLEATGAPLVKSYVFYDKIEAINWARYTNYPKVFKLRCGAAATNVVLIHSFSECKKYIDKAFGKGFEAYSYSVLKEVLRKILYKFLGKSLPLKLHKEKGYVYFQDFMPNNAYDTRIVVVAGKYAIAERRMNRENDFRASGSGRFAFDKIDIDMVRISFDVAKKLKLQSVAYDFVYDINGSPKIVEICYGFGVKGISQCPGYYTDDLEWHSCDNVPIHKWIIAAVVEELKVE